jgi:hypothetical protein
MRRLLLPLSILGCSLLGALGLYWFRAGEPAVLLGLALLALRDALQLFRRPRAER